MYRKEVDLNPTMVITSGEYGCLKSYVVTYSVNVTQTTIVHGRS